MKIGIVTLHNHNFGSALQCYATQCLLESKGYECEVIDITNGIDIIKNSLYAIWSLLLLCLKSPKDCPIIFKIFWAQRSKNLKISQKSLNALNRFNNTELNRKTYTRKYIHKQSQTNSFGIFLSGSDQVWNGSRVNEYYKYFLRFAPKQKRVGWAVSFGEGKIAKYNQRKFKKYISEYAAISVRESSGTRLIKDLTGMSTTMLCDPVLLIDVTKWREKERIKNTEPYILAFFIDQPSKAALSRLIELKDNTHLPIICFGYKHSEIGDVVYEDGDPWDFLYYIDHAEFIMTDSYHVVLFSSIFNKRFYVFERMYSHGRSQSTRINDFLKEINLNDRFEPVSLSDEIPSYDRFSDYIKVKKKVSDKFLDEVLQNVQKKCTKYDTVRGKKSLCCGCGACADVCAHHAISMKRDNEGFIFPVIDPNLCVSCGLCLRVCAFSPLEKITYQQKSYVAASRNKELNEHSASGGLFAVMAAETINKGGIVYGARLWIENGIMQCKHIGVECEDDLWMIQGSKYVQSDVMHCFPDIRKALQKGRRVMFGGTSCQVAALKSFLRREYDNLLTTDLVCHGVPNQKMLQEYIDYLSLKYKEEVTDFRFRKRCKNGNPYVISVTFKTERKVYINMRASSYYRMFMSCTGYRSSCYNCPFSSLSKPGDVTLADFYYKDRFQLDRDLWEIDMLSSILVNSKKGEFVMAELKDKIFKQEISLSDMCNNHSLLQQPSSPNLFGDSMYALYMEGGFAYLQKELSRRNFYTRIGSLLLYPLRKLKQIICRH